MSGWPFGQAYNFMCCHPQRGCPPGKGRGVSAPLYTASPPMYAWGVVVKLQMTLIVYKYLL